MKASFSGAAYEVGRSGRPIMQMVSLFQIDGRYLRPVHAPQACRVVDPAA
jgi:hypothetical protein